MIRLFRKYKRNCALMIFDACESLICFPIYLTIRTYVIARLKKWERFTVCYNVYLLVSKELMTI